MKVVAIIPARYASTRLPGKPLADILGKPMIWWVYNRIKKIRKIDEVYVATDSEIISDVLNTYSIPYVMTKDSHLTAANRLHEVSNKIHADFYLQLNGDEPLIDLNAVDAAIPESVPDDREFGTNIITEMHEPSLVMDPSNIKMVFDENMNALYMSRVPIPYPYKSINFKYFKHVGIIGYNKKMLDFYANSKPGRFESIEGIDTLRFIDYGKQLKLVIVKDCDGLSVDTQKDLEYVRTIMAEKHKA